MLTVRALPLPPRTTLAMGTSVVLLELLVKVSNPAAVSTSPIVKLIGPVGESSVIVCALMAEMEGASLTAVTTT